MMTREEAIAIFKGFKFLPREMKAVEMAIKALEQEPVYFPPCVDCNTKMNEIREAYDNLKKQSGLRWIERFDNEDKWLECPHCHTDSTEAYNYCPNCGADMRGGEECKAPSEWQQDHAILKAHADGANEVLDRIKEAREEIKDMQSHIQLKDKTTNEHWIFVDKFEVLAILGKLIAEVEG